MEPLMIGVGSQNAAKIRSVRLAAERLWPDREVVVIGVDADSGVRPQPMSKEETQAGARNRSRAVWDAINQVHYSVGLEGGLEQDASAGIWYECGWCVVLDRSGKMGIGSTARSRISSAIVRRLQGGEELSTVVEDLATQVNIRESSGYMGIITRGGLPRDQCYSHAVMFAFARFVSDPVFWSDDDDE